MLVTRGASWKKKKKRSAKFEQPLRFLQVHNAHLCVKVLISPTVKKLILLHLIQGLQNLFSDPTFICVCVSKPQLIPGGIYNSLKYTLEMLI